MTDEQKLELALKKRKVRISVYCSVLIASFICELIMNNILAKRRKGEKSRNINFQTLNIGHVRYSHGQKFNPTFAQLPTENRHMVWC